MSSLNYVVGDATKPIGDGIKIIPHICNNKRCWGRGFVLALRAVWPDSEQDYRRMIQELGQVSIFKAEPDIYIANMIAQDGIQSALNPHPIRYEVLKDTLESVAMFAKQNKASVHMPRIGSGLAGGSWEVIEEIIKDVLVDEGIEVTVYDLPSEVR